MSRKATIRFGGFALTVAGATTYLNEGNPRQGDPATELIAMSGVPVIKDGERFLPTALVIDLCTAPTGVLTVTYQLRISQSGGAPADNGTAPTLVITGASTSGKAAIRGATAYSNLDMMCIAVTGLALVPATTVDARLEGYIIGRGK